MCPFHRISLLFSFHSKTSVWVDFVIWTLLAVMSLWDVFYTGLRALKKGLIARTNELHQNFHLE